MRTVFFEDSFIEMSRVSLSVSDRGFLFGEGIFRTLRVSEGKIAYWQEHLQKLKADCHFLSLPMPSISEGEINHLILKNGAYCGTWRLKIIVSSSLLVTLEPYTYSQETKALAIFPQCMEKPSSKVKSLSYLDHLLISKYANNHKKDDALIVNHEKMILECSNANFLWLHRDSFYFSEPSLPYYEGVMQQLCLRAAMNLGFKVIPSKTKPEDLPVDAFLFTSNAMQGLVPVTQLEEAVFSRNLPLEKEFRQQLNSL